jgi:hypothetical protein
MGKELVMEYFRTLYQLMRLVLRIIMDGNLEWMVMARFCTRNVKCNIPT